MKFSIKFILIFNIIINNGFNSYAKIAPKVIDGYIDLSNWDFNVDGNTNLNGDWEFYWNKLLEPKDFHDNNVNDHFYFIKTYGEWTKQIIAGEKLPLKGYATYRLKILVPNQNKIYGLKITNIGTAYKLWYNQKFITQTGIVDSIKKNSKPQFLEKTIPLVVEKKGSSITQKLQIVIQVSNFHYNKSGIYEPMSFGLLDKIEANSKTKLIIKLIILGIILIIGLYLLLFYFFYKNNTSTLYLAVICFIILLKIIVTHDRILSFLIPNINWEFLIKLDALSSFVAIPFFAIFIYYLFKEDMPKIAMRILVFLGLLNLILVIFIPSTFYGKIEFIYKIYVISVVTYILLSGTYLLLFVLLKAAIKKRQDAILGFFSFLILFITAINEVIINFDIINTPSIIAYGFTFYLLTQAFIITKQSAKAFYKNLELNEKLNEQNAELISILEKQKNEIQKQKNEISIKREYEKQQNWHNIGLANFSEIISKNKDNINALSNIVIRKISHYIDANQGSISVYNDSDETDIYLELMGQYAFDETKFDKKRIELWEGLTGACYKEKQTIYIKNIPDNYTKITSGLGSSKPKSLLLVPLIMDEIAIGVIELASIKEMPEYKIKFIEKIAENITSMLYTAKINQQTKELLDQSKQYTNKLLANESKLNKTINKLKEKQKWHENKEKELLSKIEELKITKELF